jgi:hypothetical protein
MKAFVWKYWLIFAIALMLAAIVGMSQYADSSKKRYEDNASQTQAAPITKNETGNAQDDTQQPYKPPVWAKFVTFPEGVGAWAVILTLLAIVWQSIETRAAARATEASVDAGKDTAKKQLRAYFGVGGKLYIREDGSVEPRVSFTNCGQTPAYELQGIEYGRFETRPFKKAPAPNPADFPPHPHMVGGGQPYYFTGRSVPSGKSKESLISSLQSNDYAFILNGWYTYRDIFKDLHHIDYQLRIGGGMRPYKTIDDTGEWLAMLTDSEGNTSD